MNNNLRDFLLLHLALGNWRFQPQSEVNFFNYTYIYLTRTWDSKIRLSVLMYKPTVSLKDNVITPYIRSEYTKDLPYNNELDESLFSSGNKLVYLRIHAERREVAKVSFFINPTEIDKIEESIEILCHL